VSPEIAEKKAAEVKKLREERDGQRARQALERLSQKVRMNPKVTLIPEMVEAVTEHVTLGEIMGAIRREFGHPYDPFGILVGPAL
jgi:methylmalonyl-CoA mutase N-terminal domain/subunit